MKKLTATLMAIILAIGSITVSQAKIQDAEKNDIIEQKNAIENDLEAPEDIDNYIYSASEDRQTASQDDPIEKQFLSDFVNSLESRWKISDSTPSNLSGKQTITVYKKCVQTELDILNKYREAQFNDPWLGLLAKAYIKGLKNQNYGIESADGDYDKIDSQYWTTKGSDLRSLVIYLVTNDYGIKVNSKYSSILKEMRSTGWVLALDDPVDYLISLLNESTGTSTEKAEDTTAEKDSFEIISVSTEKSSDDYLGVHLSVKNNLDETIHTTTINVCITDKDGNIIDTTHPQEGVRLKPGKSLTFYFVWGFRRNGTPVPL